VRIRIVHVDVPEESTKDIKASLERLRQLLERLEAARREVRALAAAPGRPADKAQQAIAPASDARDDVDVEGTPHEIGPRPMASR
jgi:type II secretory pathway component PulM